MHHMFLRVGLRSVVVVVIVVVVVVVSYNFAPVCEILSLPHIRAARAWHR